LFATIFSIAETILQKSRISQRNFAYLFPCLYYIGYLLPVTCLVLLQPVCKTLSPIQSRHSRHLQPVTCHRSLILLRCSPSGRRYFPNRVCWKAPAIPTCPDTRTTPLRLENATCQPCYSTWASALRI